MAEKDTEKVEQDAENPAGPSPCFKDQVLNLKGVEGKEDKEEEEEKAPSKPINKNVPILHTLLIKEIKESDDGILLVGTFIQRMYGIHGKAFAYRFNDDAASKGVEHRRTEHHMVSIGDETIPMTRSLYIAKIPLLLDEEFDGFPFTLLRATADIELSSRTNKDGTITFRPNLMVHNEERRHNVCLQDQKWKKVESGEAPENWLKRKMDKLRKYDFISPYPEVAYLYEEKNYYCPRFRVSFLIEEEGFPKFIQVQLPMLLLSVISTCNFLVVKLEVEAEDDGEYLDEEQEANKFTYLLDLFFSTDAEKRIGKAELATNASRYLSISAAIALAAVFLLPFMFRARKTHINFSLNDLYVIAVFVAFCLVGIPPNLVSFRLGVAAVTLLWATFLIPLYNALAFWVNKMLIVRKHARFIRECPNNPFLKDNTHKEKNQAAEINGLRDLGTILKGDYPGKKWFVQTLGLQSTSKKHIVSYFEL